MVWTDELDLPIMVFLHKFGKAGGYLTQNRKCKRVWE